MMECQTESAVDFLAMTNIASHRQSSIAVANAQARGLDSSGISREHYYGGTVIGEDLRNRFPDSHGSARDHNNFACQFHDVVTFANVYGSLNRSIRHRTISYNRAALPAGDALESLIPLFPLDVVLFPGTPLPLHIFEPRYKEMIAECLSQQRTFGVVRAGEQGLADVGCTAEIVTVVKEYPDGRLDLVTEGRKRFELLRVNQERSFLQGEVLAIEDEPGVTPQAETARAVELHSELLAIAGAKQDLSAADPSVLSFFIAGSLPLDLDFKQNLLACRSEPERISLLIQYFETIIPKIQRASRAREKAGGNGHVH
jgi:Lon protease-like protein